MNLFQLGDVILSGGEPSYFKIDCDALADADIACAAELIRRLVGPFSSVEGVPRGGLRLAAALKPLKSPYPIHPHLIVDDVLTTGANMERMRRTRVLDAAAHVYDSSRTCDYCGITSESQQPDAVCPKRTTKGILGAVLFARGPCPPWIQAVFQMPIALWT